ncbi:YciI family protein [Rhizobium sp.]
MFILSLTYTAPTEAADAHMEAHMAWVKSGYDQGLFIASGRKIPRTGGVILARGERAALEALCAADPFTTHGICEYEITEMALTTTAPGFENLKA